MQDIQVAERLPRDAAWLIGITLIALMLRGMDLTLRGNDAHAYWQAWRGQMYTAGPMRGDAYLYSPAFAQGIWPLTQLPWMAFGAIFVVGAGVGLVWLVQPMGWRWGVPLWLAGLPEILSGNIYIPLAITAVLGFSRPELWAFAALTKVSLCVGPVWFFAKREWGNLLRVLGFTFGIVAVSAAFAPGLWHDWVGLLLGNVAESAEPLGAPGFPPLVYRFPFGIAVVIWGAITDRRWCVPIGMLFCTPVLWFGSFTLLAAIPRLRQGSAIAQLPSPPPANLLT